jgi:hypothetical protein
VDPDPHPAIFVIDLQDANQKLILKQVFLLITKLEGIFTSFIKLKRQKKSHKTIGFKVFLTIFA